MSSQLAAPGRPSGRLVSLDVFRGATILGMILVNNPGTWSHIYPQLEHAAWNGWTYTDTVFPFFLFIVGVAITFSFARRLDQGADPGELRAHVFRRALIIFGIGLFLNGFPFGLFWDHQWSLSSWRIPGVLQRIALCYLLASLLVLHASRAARIIWAVGLLAIYWAIMKLVPVPGYGAGALEPLGNLAWYVDSHLLAGHTWRGAPAPGFDPEGILSTLPAITTTLAGVLTGEWLRSGTTPDRKAGGLILIGLPLLLLGLILNQWFPINKNLWSPSYVVLMAGLALLVLGCSYWLIDLRQVRWWTAPFVIVGMNSIALYFASEMGAILMGLIRAGGNSQPLQEFLYQRLFLSWASPINASLFFALSYVGVMFLLGWLLWRMRWFIKI